MHERHASTISCKILLEKFTFPNNSRIPHTLRSSLTYIALSLQRQKATASVMLGRPAQGGLLTAGPIYPGAVGRNPGT